MIVATIYQGKKDGSRHTQWNISVNTHLTPEHRPWGYFHVMPELEVGRKLHSYREQFGFGLMSTVRY